MLLDTENILDSEEISLMFSDDKSVQNEEQNNDSEDNTPEIELTNQDQEDTTSETEDSPGKNIYSSIASALKEDGIFQGLDEEDLKGINDSDTFSNAFEKLIKKNVG